MIVPFFSSRVIKLSEITYFDGWYFMPAPGSVRRIYWSRQPHSAVWNPSFFMNGGKLGVNQPFPELPDKRKSPARPWISEGVEDSYESPKCYEWNVIVLILSSFVWVYQCPKTLNFQWIRTFFILSGFVCIFSMGVRMGVKIKTRICY